MLTALCFAAILWAKNSPCPELEQEYFETFLYVTVVLETMRRIPTTNQWSPAYFYAYWVLIALVSGIWPVILTHRRRWKMLRTPNIALAAVWFYMLIYYAAYFANWRSTKLDWVPMALYIVSFTAFGFWARPTAGLRRKSTTRLRPGILVLRRLPEQTPGAARFLLRTLRTPLLWRRLSKVLGAFHAVEETRYSYPSFHKRRGVGLQQ
jgi:hypothetical protein